MKVLMISPTAFDCYGKPIRLKRLNLPALTMPMLAAVTPPDVQVKVIYETSEDIPYNEHWDLVALTGMGSGTVRAWQIADEFRKRGAKVVIGGVGPTLSPHEWTMAHADSLVIGEAEDIWPQLIEDFRAGQLKEKYTMVKPPNLATVPTPRYDLINRKAIGFFRPVVATRGCPFTCEFCSVTAFSQQGYRKRPVEKVIEDVRAAKATGSNYIAFLDDNIGVDFKYCRKLWEALIPEKVIWLSQCSIHITDHPDLLELAYQSGCRLLAFGLETLNEDSLEIIDKGWNNPKRYQKAIDTVRKHGIEVSISMIMGLDGDTNAVFQKSYDFIMENRIKVPRVHLMTPTPGTPYYHSLVAEGRILHDDLGSYTGGNVVFQPKNMTREELQSGYWKLYENLFSLGNIYKRTRHNRAGLGPTMYAGLLMTNFDYRRNIFNRIVPGIT